MWDDIAPTILPAIAMVLAAYATYRATTRAKDREATAAPYSELAAELREVREWRRKIEADYDRSKRVVLILLDERPPHLALRPEVIEWLRDHYPHRLIRTYYHPGSAATPSSIIEPPTTPVRPPGPIDNP